jgi:uncharacterized protein YihD (DUF1040 family)
MLSVGSDKVSLINITSEKEFTQLKIKGFKSEGSLNCIEIIQIYSNQTGFKFAIANKAKKIIILELSILNKEQQPIISYL